MKITVQRQFYKITLIFFVRFSMVETIRIDGHEFTGYQIPTEHGTILLLQGARGFLGCGYFNIETANKMREHVAIVRGVKTFDDMLAAPVAACSSAAANLGLRPGMSGRDALLKLV